MPYPTLPRSSAALGLTALLALASCGGGPSTSGGGSADAAQVDRHARRDLAAAHFAEDRFEEALEELSPLIEASEADPEDLGRAGILAVELERPDEARGYFERALAAEPQSAVALFNLGQLSLVEYETEAAIDYFGRAHAVLPGDLPTELALANALLELELVDEADAHYAALLEPGIEVGGSWYLAVLHRRSGLLLQNDREDEGLELLREGELLRARGLSIPTAVDLRRGNLGRLLPPAPLGLPGAEALAPPTFDEPRPLGFTHTLDGLLPVTLQPLRDPTATDPIGATDWLAWSAAGLFTLGADGREAVVSDAATSLALAFDLENDGDADLLALQGPNGTQLRLFQWEPAGWQARDLVELPGPAADAMAFDFDHEGDLDLCFVGNFGLLLLRNDGADLSEGGFHDATAEAGLGGLPQLTWCLAEDLDTDQDVDLLVGGPQATLLADNLRGGLFELGAADTQSLPTVTARPLVVDHDNDARPDLFFGDGRWFRGRADRAWVETPGGPTGRLLDAARDWDGNGTSDALGLDGSGAPSLWLNLDEPRSLDLGPNSLTTLDTFAASADANGDGSDDLVELRAGEAWLHPAAPTSSTGFRLALRGIKDNVDGVGAVVEVRAAELYRRVYCTGGSLWIGLDGKLEAQVVRVTWPNGVVQSIAHHPASRDLVIKQKEGLPGSCPFLYTWDGERYSFISDVLGITPLGLPMAPGVFVPPDHDEFVLVTGEQMVAREQGGESYYDLQFTEELREVTYLDRVRLEVIDHPIGTEVFPDERFCFPPFPGEHTHITEDPRPPISAHELLPSGELGRDWALELSAIDGDYAAPFTHYRGRFQGLTEPHVVELRFDGDAIASAEKLRLFLTGWFFWTDASVNMAAARTPGVDFIPPILQVPDGAGGWRDLGPPVGFPAGKTKTMVIDVSGALDPTDPRLRIFSTLRLYWDSIRLATDGDDAPMRVTKIEASSAELWERGFSRPVPMAGTQDLEWFEWDQLEPEPRWNQHPGQYTRHGDVLPLLGEADDRFVILGAGDALRLLFPADQAPPLPEGWRRDYLVYLDGWAKDRDPNAVEVEFVEPLPFHAMSGFPYGEDESFPDDELHRTWRREWNTRPAKTWIEPLAPER